jgi:S1-C subfamily serine protease
MLVGCQTTGDVSSSGNNDLFSIFDNSKDKVKKLINANKLNAAVQMYLNNENDFQANDGLIVKAELKNSLLKEIGLLYSDLESINFINLNEDLIKLNKTSNFIKANSKIFAKLGVTSEGAKLTEKLKTNKEQQEIVIKDELTNYLTINKPLSYGSSSNYFSSYKTQTTMKSYEERRRERLKLPPLKNEKTSKEETSKEETVSHDLTSFFGKVCSTIPNPNISSFFKCKKEGFDSSVSFSKEVIQDKSSALSVMQEVQKNSEELGVSISSSDESKIFKAFGFSNISIRRISEQPNKNNYPRALNEIVVYTNELAPKEVVTEEMVNSSFLSGERMVENPDFQRVQVNYNNAIRMKDDCLTQYYIQSRTNPYAINLCVLHDVAIGTASAALQNTSRTLTKKTYDDYSYLVTNSLVTKPTQVKIVSLNKSSGFDIISYTLETKQNFKFADGLHSKDRSSSNTDFHNDNDVKLFLNKELIQAELLAPMVKNFVVNNNEVSTFKNYKRTILASQKSVNTDSKHEKILSNSIVLIKTRAGIGSGFYIKPNYILTNQHVVGNSPIVKISKKDGSNTSGVVMAYDESLDLALVAVPELNGTPLQLSSKRPQTGENVLAYGHPKGYQYSVSKGIVSSERKLPVKAAALTKMVTYVQSDVAMSPGNSGGPLLQNGTVIGVASWKRIDSGSEGLSFSISSREILDWLNSLKNFNTN